MNFHSPNDLDTRNKQRSIISKNDFSYSPAMARISIQRVKNGIALPSLGIDNPNGYTNIKFLNIEGTSGIALFHEMIHWYHALRNIVRQDEDGNITNNMQIDVHYIGQYYWRNFLPILNNATTLASGKNWIGRYGVVDFEEMRTILGMPVGLNNCLEGDDMCENLYRIEIGTPLRYGYGEEYIEDTIVTNLIIADVINSATNIGIFPVQIRRAHGEVDILPLTTIGIGHCRVS